MTGVNVLSRACPNCTGQSLTRTDEVSTEDGSARTPWQDEDGRWYDGPNRQFTVTRCGQCGWSEHVTRRRGKIVHSVTCHPVSASAAGQVTVIRQQVV